MHRSDILNLSGLCDSSERSQVAVETKWLYRMRWIIKIKQKHGCRACLPSMFITKILRGCERSNQVTNVLYRFWTTRGRSCSLLVITGCWAEVTLPASHTMSIVSGLISSASLGFLALYLFFSLTSSQSDWEEYARILHLFRKGQVSEKKNQVHRCLNLWLRGKSQQLVEWIPQWRYLFLLCLDFA